MDERKVAQYLTALEGKSKDFAQAKAQLVAMDHNLKTQEAMLFLKYRETAKSIEEAKMRARADDEYRVAWEGLAAATEQVHSLEWEMKCAQWRIELARTNEATRRVEMQNLGG